MLTYFALFEPAEEGGFVVQFPDIQHGVTQGETLEEATAAAVRLLEVMLTELIKRGEQIPPAKNYGGERYRPVSLPREISAVLG